MNYSIIFKLLSIIMAALGIAFSVSLIFPLFFYSTPIELASVNGFIISIVVTTILSYTFYYYGKKGCNKIFRKEALAIIGLGWFLASLIGALPYWFVLDSCSFVDAFFESASGLTTTGASVFSDLEKMPKTILFWRSMSQWIGGLGVIVFFVAILTSLGAGAKILFSRESSAQAADLESSRIQTGIAHLLYLYLGLSILCTLIYKLCGLNMYNSINHMFTTLSTGGFSTRSASISAFENPLFEWMVILFMCLGGTSFVFLIRLLRQDWSSLRQMTEVKAYYAIIIIATLLIFILIWDPSKQNWQNTLRTSLFQVVSIMTTTGFVTANSDLWIPGSKIILLVLMIVGGCSGSTGGGIKVLRCIVGFKICQQEIEKSYRSRIVRSLKCNGHYLSETEQHQTIIFLAMSTLVAILGTILLGIIEPDVSVEGLISAIFASLFNVGPGFAEVGATMNFAFFSKFSKILLSILMIAGRLELFAVLALFSPRLWKKY